MPEVQFLPWNLTVEAEEGDSLLQAALEADVPLPHSCGGDAVCSTCAVEILEGAECLGEMEDLEAEALAKLLPGSGPEIRLACQARLCADTHTPLRIRALQV